MVPHFEAHFLHPSSSLTQVRDQSPINDVPSPRSRPPVLRILQCQNVHFQQIPRRRRHTLTFILRLLTKLDQTIAKPVILKAGMTFIKKAHTMIRSTEMAQAVIRCIEMAHARKQSTEMAQAVIRSIDMAHARIPVILLTRSHVEGEPKGIMAIPSWLSSEEKGYTELVSLVQKAQQVIHSRHVFCISGMMWPCC